MSFAHFFLNLENLIITFTTDNKLAEKCATLQQALLMNQRQSGCEGEMLTCLLFK